MKINLTDEQAYVLIDALDLYTRVHLGQFEEVANVALEYNICREGDEGDSEPEDFHDLREAIGRLKWMHCGFPQNGSHGIHNKKVHEHGKMCYDMQKVLRRHLAYKRSPEGGSTVDFDTPRQIANHPLCKIED